jgi:GNAT superfamily N-acetyltransferase
MQGAFSVIAERIDHVKDFALFSKFSRTCYRKAPHYRSTEHDVEKLVLEGPSSFHSHAEIACFIIREANTTIGRFALIHDLNDPAYIKVSFFEALPDCGDILSLIRSRISRLYPDIHKFTIGINGHLNYSAGFLLNRFEEPPVFGLPYTHDYYPAYFRECRERRMVSFRFPNELFFSHNRKLSGTITRGISVQPMNRKYLDRYVQYYTMLNNKAFSKHPYWSDRTAEEDLELFRPFKYLLKDENLLFAYIDDTPVGFLLWYPDFNQLVKRNNDHLNILSVVNYRLRNPIDTFRFTEVGVLPAYRHKPVSLALISAMIPHIERQGYRYCEGGFIFLENKQSIALARRSIKRVTGIDSAPYRTYTVYEGTV